MNAKIAKKIISEYKPHKGFFDLSEKPTTLSNSEYATVLNLQNNFAYQNERKDYIKQHNPKQWEELKDYSARLQMIILEHWGDKIFKGGQAL